MTNSTVIEHYEPEKRLNDVYRHRIKVPGILAKIHKIQSLYLQVQLGEQESKGYE